MRAFISILVDYLLNPDQVDKWYYYATHVRKGNEEEIEWKNSEKEVTECIKQFEKESKEYITLLKKYREDIRRNGEGRRG